MIEWLLSLNGIGTELGLFNTVLVFSLATVITWGIKREIRRVKLERLDILWDEYEYQQRKEKSDVRRMPTEAELAKVVSDKVAELMKEKE